MNAATKVFNIPELLELILQSLPCNTTHSEIASMRTMHISRTTSRTWHSLLHTSPTIRHRLYLSTALDRDDSTAWLSKTPFPPAEPNPWIPHILLNQRSWGSAWPFENIYTAAMYEGISPSKPKFWTFSLELSRAQYSRLPPAGAWRDLLATSPPFTDFWYTRCFYELGSGRAPFVTHIDYNPKVPKSRQKYRVHCPEGVTLGDLVDAFCHLFEMHSAAKFVMVESVRCVSQQTVEDGPTTKSYLPGSSAEFALEEQARWAEVEMDDERPRTKSWIPGSSAERAHGWQRGQY